MITVCPLFSVRNCASRTSLGHTKFLRYFDLNSRIARIRQCFACRELPENRYETDKNLQLFTMVSFIRDLERCLSAPAMIPLVTIVPSLLSEARKRRDKVTAFNDVYHDSLLLQKVLSTTEINWLLMPNL